MPTLNTRTDVLSNLVSQPITKTQEPTVIRELASVVIALSSDVFEVMRILKGSNGDGDGLIDKVDDVSRDVQSLLTKIEGIKTTADKAKEDAEDAQKHTPFTDFVKWLVEKILPSLVTGVIVFIVIVLLQHYSP